MKVVLLEFVEEAREVLNRGVRETNSRNPTLFLSLNPKVEAFLKSKDMSCENTLNYFSNESHRMIVEKTEKAIQAILNQCTFKDEFGVSKTYSHFFAYHIRFYLAYFFVHLEIINNIIKKLQPTEIVAFHKNEIMQSAFLDDQEKFLGVMTERIGGIKGVRVSKAVPALISIRNIKRQIDNIICALTSFYFRLYYKACLKFQFPKLHQLVISATWGYKFDDLLSEIKQRHPGSKSLILEKCETAKRAFRFILMSFRNVFKLSEKLSFSDYSLPINLLCSRKPNKEDAEFVRTIKDLRYWMEKEEQCELFSHHDVNIADLLIKKIEKGLFIEMIRLKHEVECIYQIYKKSSPRVVISPFSTGPHYAMGELASLLGIESCIISHGTHVPPNNSYEETENYWLGRGVILNDYQTIAIQSPWTDRFLTYYGDSRKRLYCGPVIFSQRKNICLETWKGALGIPQNHKVVLYATTQKVRYGNRLYITETTDEFLSSLTDLIGAIDSTPDLSLIIRPHPICDLTENDFFRLLPKSNRFRVVKSGKFESLLSGCDCLVSYSSTCIEEALANQIPVVLYDRWKRYNHFNLKALSGYWDLKTSPVCYITDPEVLREQLLIFSRSVYNEKMPPDIFEPFRYDTAWRERFFNYIADAISDGKLADQVQTKRESIATLLREK